MADGGKRTCSGCGNGLADSEGVKLWDTWFCSLCFISHSAKLHREMRPEDIIALRTMGRELAGYLPPEVVEMVAIGFYRRVTGRQDEPPADELARFVGEIQRLNVLSTMRKVTNLMKTWQDSFTEFVEQSEAEVRETVKRLTDFE